MSSFLDRLRAWDRWGPPVQEWGEIVKVVNATEPVSLSECAAEIERLCAENARLREALREISELSINAQAALATYLARAALAEKENNS